MSIYVIIGTFMDTHRCGFGHETGVVILLGMLIAYGITFSGRTVTTAHFNPHLLFNICLPLILFAAGYNMRRKRFFENISNITMFGVLSTVVCFVILTSLTILVFQ